MSQLDSSLSLSFVEGLLDDYLKDPKSVPEDWRQYFEGLSQGNGSALASFRPGPSFEAPRLFAGAGVPRETPESGETAAPRLADAHLQHRVDELIRTFRIRGHLYASVDPLREPELLPAELDPLRCGFTEDELDLPVATDHIPGPDVQTVRQLVARMCNTYCQSIGAEFMHINDLELRKWLQTRIELSENLIHLSRAEQLRILERLTGAIVFENFIQKKYLGAKSFSLEGAESLIPLLDLMIEKLGQTGTREIVLGMAHRGRLNVLANILGKHPRQIFREFEDTTPEHYLGRGDVKYHLGFSSDWFTEDGESIHLSLCFNPSHLEFINTVAQGRIRAKQDRAQDSERRQGAVILIHGDAAFAGEGIVQETLNLSELEAYSIGGTLHIVVNNQIGFTTSPHQSRSNTYATDIAKMLQIPIFHVNGEDPESVAQVVGVALDFRARYQSDVVIDMYCYRRRGHNEGDEPAFTQPLLYRDIRARPAVSTSYLEHLLRLGEVTREEAEKLIHDVESHLEAAWVSARSATERLDVQAYAGLWEPYEGGPDMRVPNPETGVERDRLEDLLEKLTTVPETFRPHPKIKRLLDTRRAMSSDDKPLDWATAEALAFASLAAEGASIRMSGQDCERGTFSQRHAVLHDVETDATYVPLHNLADDQAPVEIYNSPLSEAGVLGFEYGYSLDHPDGLVLWEAQFGDFCNAAQVIIDQFISSAEDKWNRLSGLTLLLPHGFEGAGPEHSSARLERWLTMAAEDNLQIVYPSTPAQYFHVLRRQVVRNYRKPLVILTPKSLLRHAAVVSPLDELAHGRFQKVLRDGHAEPGSAKRILMCSGKIFYDLDHRCRELGRTDVAIVRLEQLYPMPTAQLREALEPYADGTPVVWVQEEPRNMGAWPYLRLNFADKLFDRLPLHGVYRKESASPATGSASSHRAEQEELVSSALAGP